MQVSAGVLWMEINGYMVSHYKRNVSLNSKDIWKLWTFESIIIYINSVRMNCIVELSEYILLADWCLLRHYEGINKFFFCVKPGCNELMQISMVMRYITAPLTSWAPEPCFVSTFVRQRQKSLLLFLNWQKDLSEVIPRFRETSVVSWET